MAVPDTEKLKRQIAADAEAIADPATFAVPMRRAVRVSGLSKSSLYRAVSEGRLVGRKCCGTSLIDYASLLELYNSSPLIISVSSKHIRRKKVVPTAS